MRKMVLAAALLIVAWASQPRQAWAEERCPGNLTPMYEGVIKNDAMLSADERLRATNAKQGRTPAQGAAASVQLGWRYFTRDHDPATAMKRFNQAWLLDPDNGNAYYGMAVMVDVLRTIPAFNACAFTPALSERLFKLALNNSSTAPEVHVDYGRFLGFQERYDEALKVLLSIIEKRPTIRNAHANIAHLYYRQNDFQRACAWALVAKGKGDVLEPGFLKDMCAQAHPDG